MCHLAYPHLMRNLSCSLMVSFVLLGCLSIGSRQIQSPTSAAPKTEDSRALLIIVDSLNHGVLKEYLQTLLDADHEPRWQSGLSLLAREQFKLANAQYPMASIPTFTTTAEATLATGQPPIQHGLIGTRFNRNPSTAPEQDISVYDLSFQSEFLEEILSEGEPINGNAKSSLILGSDPWVKTLHPTRETISVFTPYGQEGIGSCRF